MPLEIRQSRLSEDVEKYLDSMSSNGWLSPAGHMACMLYGAEEPLAAIAVPNTDRRPFPTDASGAVAYMRENRVTHETMMDTQRRTSLELERYAVTIIDQLEPARAGMLKSIGLAYILRERTSNLEFLMDWRVKDAVVGGCNAKMHKKPRLTASGTIPHPQAKRLANPQRIKAYVRREQMVHHLGRVLRVLMTIKAEPVFNQADMDAITADFERQMLAYRDDEARYWQARINAGRDPVESRRGPLVKLKPGVRKKYREEAKRRKKVMTKSVRIASAILGDEPVRQFVRGKRILIPGETLDFEITRASSLASIGHGGLRIALKSKDGAKLSGLCLYEEAPPLDQAATIALFCGAGDEASLIAAGNLFDVALGAERHPLLQPKGARPAIIDDDAAADNLADAILRAQEAPGPADWANDRHIETLVLQHRDQYGHIYSQEVDRYIFGDMAKGIHEAWNAGRIMDAEAIPSFSPAVWQINQQVAAREAA